MDSMDVAEVNWLTDAVGVGSYLIVDLTQC